MPQNFTEMRITHHLTKTIFFGVFIMAIALTACMSEGENSNSMFTVKEDDTSQTSFQKAKKVFYSLPSPIESAIILKRCGVEYDPDVLNPVENLNSYTTTKSMAVNFGIYGADISYASLFEQTQTVLRYISVMKRLADDLGILEVINESTVANLEKNALDPNKTAEIISETFMNSNSYLQENKRSEIATLILLGGWLEGLYISTQLSNSNLSSNHDLVNKVLDQRLSIESLLSLLEEFNNESKINDLIPDIRSLKEIFDKIQVTASKIVPVVDKENDITILKSESQVTINEEDYKLLCDKVAEIRTKYIKM